MIDLRRELSLISTWDGWMCSTGSNKSPECAICVGGGFCFCLYFIFISATVWKKIFRRRSFSRRLSNGLGNYKLCQCSLRLATTKFDHRQWYRAFNILLWHASPTWNNNRNDVPSSPLFNDPTKCSSPPVARTAPLTCRALVSSGFRSVDHVLLSVEMAQHWSCSQ
jgi:hypothetical protein